MTSKEMSTLIDEKLKTSIKKIIAKFKTEHEEGEQFNIFVSAGISEKENYMRNFLAELLRKDGSHGQGNLFLKSFVHDVLGIVDMKEEEIEAISIDTEEKTFENGTERRMDITIDSGEKFKRFIPIEVKINARDQYKQCYDYHREAGKRYNNPNPVVYYLAKDDTHVISPKSQDNLEVNVDLKYIYFKKSGDKLCADKKSIVEWLEECSEKVDQQGNVYFCLKQFQKSIESWFNRDPELDEVRKAVDKALNPSKLQDFMTGIRSYSGEDEVILKIKKCYDYYKNTILDNEFFGGIDAAMSEHIERTIPHTNRGSDYKCEPIQTIKEKYPDEQHPEYDIWLIIEPAIRERLIYVGYCLTGNKDGKYVSYKKSTLYNDEQAFKELLGSGFELDNIPSNEEWLFRTEIPVDCKEIENLVFDKDALNDKINQCVQKLNELLEKRYRETKNAQPHKAI